MLDIASNVLPSHPDWKWYLIGDGEDRDMLEKEIKTRNLKDQLIMTGQLEDVSKYLSCALIYCLTSRSEGLPMVLLEAKTWGVASVSFDIHTGPSDIITDRKNGILVSPGDCKEMAKSLSLLMDDPSLLKKYTACVRDDIERFSMDEILSEWIGIFNALS